MPFLLHTERLLLRTFQPTDATGFYLLNAHPETIRHTGDSPFASVAEARDFINHYNHYARYGYGRWAVLTRQTQMFIGFCGLKYHPDTGETDIGYRINYDYWGRGYATEAAQACLTYGLHELGLARIIGRVRQANTGSIRVLEKIGMTREKRFDFEGYPGFLYVA